MFRVIQAIKPTWIIAENVRGILNIEGGVVFQQVCLDLESIGYEVQPIVIPAVAVNAPHRRDRVWFIAHAKSGDGGRELRNLPSENETESRPEEQYKTESSELKNANSDAPPPDTRGLRRHEPACLEKRSVTCCCSEPDVANASSDGSHSSKNTEGDKKRDDRNTTRAYELCEPERSNTIRAETTSWNIDWLKIATEFCSMDDGLPAELGGLKLSKSRHRVEQLKGYGNAIVPQVAYEIFKQLK
jgi:DNA (cytosine-5)-methyltransferase 1